MSDDKPPKQYRARSIAVPDWYVAERAAHYGRIGKLEEAMTATKEWWEENLAPGWEKFFDLEEVEEEGDDPKT
jgi:hypothetical protein